MTQPVHDPLVAAVADTSARLRDAEANIGRNTTEIALNHAASAQLRFDLDIVVKQVNGKLDVQSMTLAEILEQVRRTNGRMNALETWKGQHEAATEPLLKEAREALPAFKKVREWYEAQRDHQRETATIRRFLRGLGRDLWKTIFAVLGLVTAAALAVQSAPELFERLPR